MDDVQTKERPSFELSELEGRTLHDLHGIAKDLGIPGVFTPEETGSGDENHARRRPKRTACMFRDGILEILPEGFGFLRVHGFLASSEDVYVSQSQIKRFNLRTGDTVSGAVRPPKDSERYYSLLRIEAINSENPETIKRRINFDDLIPVFPR